MAQQDLKNTLSKYFKKKIDSVKIIEAKNINNDSMTLFNTFNCLIIDNYNNNIEENIFYSLLNQSKQNDTFLVINSSVPIQDVKFNLIDLKSRAQSFINVGIDLPTDDLLRVIITKYFSDKQIEITPKYLNI